MMRWQSTIVATLLLTALTVISQRAYATSCSSTQGRFYCHCSSAFSDGSGIANGCGNITLGTKSYSATINKSYCVDWGVLSWNADQLNSDGSDCGTSCGALAQPTVGGSSAWFLQPSVLCAFPAADRTNCEYYNYTWYLTQDSGDSSSAPAGSPSQPYSATSGGDNSHNMWFGGSSFKYNVCSGSGGGSTPVCPLVQATPSGTNVGANAAAPSSNCTTFSWGYTVGSAGFGSAPGLGLHDTGCDQSVRNNANDPYKCSAIYYCKDTPPLGSSNSLSDSCILKTLDSGGAFTTKATSAATCSRTPGEVPVPITGKDNCAPPGPVTVAADSLVDTQATLHASIANPALANGEEFQYSSTTSNLDAGTGVTSVSVYSPQSACQTSWAKTITVDCGRKTYYFRAKISPAGGGPVQTGVTMSFVTAACPAPPAPPAPPIPKTGGVSNLHVPTNAVIQPASLNKIAAPVVKKP